MKSFNLEAALAEEVERLSAPKVTSEMKKVHIGEYYWEEYAPYYNEFGELQEYTATHTVPWDLCKSIYIGMAKTALLSDLSAEVEPSPSLSELVEALEFYARGDHLLIGDETEWEAASGEPENWIYHETIDVGVENGEAARQALSFYRPRHIPQSKG